MRPYHGSYSYHVIDKRLALSHAYLPHVPIILFQSVSSISPRMDPSYTKFSSGQDPRRSLGDLHRFVMDLAANHVRIPATPMAFSGPDRPISTYLGEETIEAGPISEAAIQIMFRCVRGLGIPSCHVLVRMKPSLSEEVLALRLCQIFGIPTTGNVVIQPMIKWMPGLMPFQRGMDRGKYFSGNLLKTVPCADLTLVLPFSEVARTISSTMSGIVDIKVLIREERLGNCTICVKKDVLALAAEMNVRMWAIGGCVLCDRCVEYEDVIRVFPQTHLGNGYIRVTP